MLNSINYIDLKFGTIRDSLETNGHIDAKRGQSKISSSTPLSLLNPDFCALTLLAVSWALSSMPVSLRQLHYLPEAEPYPN